MHDVRDAARTGRAEGDPGALELLPHRDEQGLPSAAGPG